MAQEPVRNPFTFSLYPSTTAQLCVGVFGSNKRLCQYIKRLLRLHGAARLESFSTSSSGGATPVGGEGPLSEACGRGRRPAGARDNEGVSGRPCGWAFGVPRNRSALQRRGAYGPHSPTAGRGRRSLIYCSDRCARSSSPFSFAPPPPSLRPNRFRSCAARAGPGTRAAGGALELAFWAPLPAALPLSLPVPVLRALPQASPSLLSVEVTGNVFSHKPRLLRLPGPHSDRFLPFGYEPVRNICLRLETFRSREG